MPASVRGEVVSLGELTVERLVVRSNRDDEIVVGPLESRKLADQECDRLNREQMRAWITGGETGAGEPIEPPGYRVEPFAAPDVATRQAFLKDELEQIAKQEKREPAEHLTNRREQIEAELDA